jgi:hypothetical protein
MKRSEMLDIIADRFEASDINVEGTTYQEEAEILLKLIEEAGMLPPAEDVAYMEKIPGGFSVEGYLVWED